MSQNNAAQPADVLVNYEVYQEGELVTSGNSLAHAEHYAQQYSQDGPVELRTSISIPGFHAVESALLPKLRASVAKPPAVSEDFAHEVWAAAQSPHGERVEDSVARVVSLLAEWRAPVFDTLPLEKALYELVDKIVPGLDTGDILQDARQASAMLGSIMASAHVAAPSDETLRLASVIADKIEDGTLFQSGIFSRRELADKVRTVVRVARQSAPVAGEAYQPSAQSTVKDDKAALGLPECGKPLCAPGEHHPLCRHGWAEKKAASAPVAGEAMQLLRSIREQDYLSDTMRHRIDRLLTKAAPQASEADIIEDVAKQWDGCIYDAGPGGDIDIGKAIRNAASKHKGQAGQQRAAGDERAAFEATYQADYDDPGAACEREHFGKGYRACLAAQSAKEQGESDA